MSASLKKFEANRMNALKSARPKSASPCRLNATRHGVLSGEVLVRGENRKALKRLRDRFNAELAPVGIMEEILVDRIVSSVWRLKRCLRVERRVIEFKEADDELDTRFFNPAGDSRKAEGQKALRVTRDKERIDVILRYETTLERQIYRALHELIRLKCARNGEKPLAPIAVDVDVTGDRGME